MENSCHFPLGVLKKGQKESRFMDKQRWLKTITHLLLVITRYVLLISLTAWGLFFCKTTLYVEKDCEVKGWYEIIFR